MIAQDPRIRVPDPYPAEGRCAVGANDLDFGHGHCQHFAYHQLFLLLCRRLFRFPSTHLSRAKIVGVLLINTLLEEKRDSCTSHSLFDLSKNSRNRFGMLGGTFCSFSFSPPGWLATCQLPFGISAQQVSSVQVGC